MLKFKRLSDLSKDEKVIVEALKQSKAGLLEGSEDGSKIRRDPAIPLPENTEESRKLLEARTAYAKGFPKESTTLDELIEYYNESNPDVVSIQMRNYCEKKGKEKVWKFKGSIFLTFKTEEAAKAFVEKEEKYKEGALMKKFQKDYLLREKRQREGVEIQRINLPDFQDRGGSKSFCREGGEVQGRGSAEEVPEGLPGGEEEGDGREEEQVWKEQGQKAKGRGALLKKFQKDYLEEKKK